MSGLDTDARLAILNLEGEYARTWDTVDSKGWAGFGLACFLMPTAVLSMTGVELTTSASLTEVRAMYGGAQLGFGAFLVAASLRTDLARPALIALAFVMGGFALGRLFGIALDGSTDAVNLASLATEVFTSGLAVTTLRLQRVEVTTVDRGQKL